jgi:Zn-finger nucleic acid-binding protein
MNCPIDAGQVLEAVTLAEGLPAHRCAVCTGVWLSSNEYLRWVTARPSLLPETDAGAGPVPTWDTQTLKLCPECGHYLTRYRVLPNVQFWLDRCGHCNGVWFDKQEWETVTARNLQDKVNQFFTKPYQDKLRQTEAAAQMEKLYQQKFSAADYAQLKAVYAWLRPHPQRAMLLAYLQANDPYKI